MKTFIKHLALSATAAAFAFTAHATPTLSLTDGNATVEVTDNGVGDSNLAIGVVTYIGSVGSTWIVNVTTGVSGSPNGFMDLASVDGSQISSLFAGALTITFSDTGFITPGSAEASIGGTSYAEGVVIYSTFWDSTNALFGTAGFLTGQAYVGTSFSGDEVSSDPISGVYSLTQVVTILHDREETTSFGASLKVPDQSTTSLLMALGLLGVGLAVRRFAPKTV